MNGVTNPSQLEGANGVSSVPTLFKIREVDGLTSLKPNIKADIDNDLEMATNAGLSAQQAELPILGELNILEKLQGEFLGAGLNMIFRPSFGNNRRNNVLEYNVTKEVTQFSPDIGDVPNRGLGKQQDVFLKAVPYNQWITDMLNPETGQPNQTGGGIPIHYESGMFLRTPPTDVRPVVPKGTISRLASIPHGTAINCQGFEPDMNNPIPGKPNIKPVSVLPFPMGTPEDLETFAEFFPQLNFDKKYDLRIPQEIKSGGILTAPLMSNPNLMLIEFNDNSTKKRITEHLFFSVHSDPKVSGIPGGGTANTAFLAGSGIRDGRQNPGPNADGVSVGCDYWISTVEYDVLLPEGDFPADKNKNIIVDSEARKEEKDTEKIIVSPCFKLELDKNLNIPPNTVVKLKATQIQYSQNVTLDFDEMGWPHISVATLSPSKPVPIKASQIVF
jgi:hypothetical protein